VGKIAWPPLALCLNMADFKMAEREILHGRRLSGVQSDAQAEMAGGGILLCLLKPCRTDAGGAAAICRRYRAIAAKSCGLGMPG